MVSLLNIASKPKVSSRVSEEFDNYLIEQRIKTTFNGIEVAAFSWYKRLLGLE